MSTYQPLLNYIENYWPRIIRHQLQDEKTLIGLPYPYLVPAAPSGQNMFQEMYYWDSYFMALGLVGSSHEQLIIDMAENMAYLFQRFGVIPNGSRYYFLSRSQPPFFVEMIKLAHEIKSKRGDSDSEEFLRRMVAIASEEYETVWLGTSQPHHRLVYAGLSRYFDINYLDILAACEGGWDHSPRCDDRWLEHLPIDLNSILHRNEVHLAEITAELGDEERSKLWVDRAQQRRLTIQRLLWDEDSGFFFDYDFVKQRITPYPSLAGFFPLWGGVATAVQAKRIVDEWLPRFEYAGGLVTTLEPKEGRQWGYPNGWAPLQLIVTVGLDKYGYHAEANRIRRAWCDNCAAVFARTGAMWEKYNVVTLESSTTEEGLYGQVNGFGWTNAVFVDFAKRLLKINEQSLENGEQLSRYHSPIFNLSISNLYSLCLHL